MNHLRRFYLHPTANHRKFRQPIIPYIQTSRQYYLHCNILAEFFHLSPKNVSFIINTICFIKNMYSTWNNNFIFHNSNNNNYNTALNINKQFSNFNSEVHLKTSNPFSYITFINPQHEHPSCQCSIYYIISILLWSTYSRQ